LLVQNPDRRKTNANCAFLGRDVFVYDFDTAFSFLLSLGSDKTPWKVCDHGTHSDHVFRAALCKKQVNWRPFLDDLAGLTSSRLSSIADCLPEEWKVQIPKVCEHLLTMASHTSDFAIELQRSIS